MELNVCLGCSLNFAWASTELFHWSVLMLVLAHKSGVLLTQDWLNLKNEPASHECGGSDWLFLTL